MEKLPIAYRLGMLSIIKEMIYKGSKSYYQKIFVKNEQSLKPFAHATFIQNISIKDEKIFGNRLFLTVSSPSYEFMMHLMNGSSRGDIYKYQNFIFELRRKRLLPSPPTFGDIVVFKTLSPLLIEN